VQTVPAALRSKSGIANKRIGQGEGYKYSHDFPENISGQALSGEETAGALHAEERGLGSEDRRAAGAVA